MDYLMPVIRTYPDTSGVVRVDVSELFNPFPNFPLIVPYVLYEQCRDAGLAIKLWHDPK